MQTRQTWDAMLLDIFAEGSDSEPKRQFNDDAIIFNLFKNRGAPGGRFEGKNYIWPVQTRRGAGVGYSQDTTTSAATYPAAKRARGVRAQIGYRTFFGSIKITKELLDVSSGDNVAFGSQAAFEMKDMITGMTKRLNYGAFLDGTGVIGRLNGTPTAAGVCTLDARGVNYGYTDTADPDTGNREYGSRYFWEDLTLRARSAAMGTAGSGNVRAGVADVGSLDSPTQITLDPAALPTGWVDNDFLVVAGSHIEGAEADDGAEMNGLQMLVDNGDIAEELHEIPRLTANAFYRSAVQEGPTPGTARPITNGLMQLLYDTVKAASGGRKTPSRWILNEHVMRRILDLHFPDVRQVPQKLAGGWTSMTWGGGDGNVEFTLDTDCTDGTMFLIRDDSFFVPIWKKLGWDDRGGPILHRPPSDEHALQARAYIMLNFGCWQPNANGVLRDLEFSTTA